MRKLSLMLIAVAAVLSLTAIPALADQLSLGSTVGPVYFCNIGGEIFLSTNSGCTPTGGTINANNGSFDGIPSLSNQPWSFGLPSFGWIVSGVDIVPAGTPSTNSFSWGGSGGVGAITGTVTWSFLSDHSSSSKLAGSMVIGANSNAGMLGIDFPVGASVSIDYTFAGLNPTVGGLLSAGSGHSRGTGSNGEVLPAVPEPGAVFLLGVGFLVVGTFLRRRGQAHVG